MVFATGSADDGRRTTDDGRRTTDDGRRTTDDGRRTMDDGRWTTDDGRRTMDDGRWTTDDRSVQIEPPVGGLVVILRCAQNRGGSDSVRRLILRCAQNDRATFSRLCCVASKASVPAGLYCRPSSVVRRLNTTTRGENYASQVWGVC